jgi:hypothetical protein
VSVKFRVIKAFFGLILNLNGNVRDMCQPDISVGWHLREMDMICHGHKWLSSAVVKAGVNNDCKT